MDNEPPQTKEEPLKLEELTEDLKEELLYHFRAAALARAKQRDHEGMIEGILQNEINNTQMEHFAAGVEGDADTLLPDDLQFIKWQDIESILFPGQ